jgi:cytochrome c556
MGVMNERIRGSAREATQRSAPFLIEFYTLVLTFLAVAFVAGCKPSAETSATDNREATANQFDKVTREAKEAAQEMKDYAYAQKAEFVEKMQNQLSELNKDLDQISAKIEKSSDAAKAGVKTRYQALRDQAARLNRQLDEAKDATESTWDSVKAGTRKAYEGLKDGVQQSRQWLSEKIAP